MSSKSPDEQPKDEIAKKVVTATHQYFSPEHPGTIEAEDAQEAAKELKRRTAGDAE